MISLYRDEKILLRCGDATAVVASLGAELLSWYVKGRELLWGGDPIWWDKTAPILFPVIGASLGGCITIAGKSYPMPVHGFAQGQRFQIIDSGNEWAHLRLINNEESEAFYPFSFQLDVRFVLEKTRLVVFFDVSNPGHTILPYALGFHPGFVWKSDQGEVLFEQAMKPDIPIIAPGGFLSHHSRQVDLRHKSLKLSSELFEHGALVFRDSDSRTMMLKDADGFCVHMHSEGFQHLAVWSKPLAPFVSLESWTGHADWENDAKDFFERDGIIRLLPEQQRHHSVTLSSTDATTC